MLTNYEQVLRQTTTLPAQRIVLRAFSLDDAADVLEYGSDPQALRYLIWPGVTDLDGARESITGYYLANPGIYAIEHKADGKCIGCIDLRIEPEHEKAGFGYILNRRYWNQGYMSETLQTVLSLCFRTLELNRVEATHYAGNEGSGRVMEKCGMRREGFSPSQVKVKGAFHDVVHYGITCTQWHDFVRSSTAK